MQAIADRQLLEELKRKRLVRAASALAAPNERVASGLAELDRMAAGGLPRGRISELVGVAPFGLAVVYRVLAAATGRGENCALVDAADDLDVGSARRAGVDLRRLLWVRGNDGAYADALRAAEWLLQAGLFGLVSLDLGRGAGRLVPAHWLRLGHLARASGAVVLVSSAGTGRDAAPIAGAFAALTVRVSAGPIQALAGGERLLRAGEPVLSLMRVRGVQDARDA